MQDGNASWMQKLIDVDLENILQLIRRRDPVVWKEDNKKMLQ